MHPIWSDNLAQSDKARPLNLDNFTKHTLGKMLDRLHETRVLLEIKLRCVSVIEYPIDASLKFVLRPWPSRKGFWMTSVVVTTANAFHMLPADPKFTFRKHKSAIGVKLKSICYWIDHEPMLSSNSLVPVDHGSVSLEHNFKHKAQANFRIVSASTQKNLLAKSLQRMKTLQCI